MKLHLGCGDVHKDGYINIDKRKTKATDNVMDATELHFIDNSIEIIENHHLIEHLGREDILLPVLKDWYRMITPGGKLIIECPNFDEAIKEYLAGNEKRLDNIFGLQRFDGDTHFWGYNLPRLKRLLQQAGFSNIEEKEPQDYHAKDEPCLRIECIAHKGETKIV